MVVGRWIFALAPLSGGRSEGRAHDGAPGGAASVVFFEWCGRAIVVQAKRVADLVGSGERSNIDTFIPCPTWGIGTVGETIQISYAPCTGKPIIRRGDDVHVALPDECGIIFSSVCRDVDIEAPEILCHDSPDPFNFGGTVIRRFRDDVGTGVVLGPSWVGDCFAVEVQINHVVRNQGRTKFGNEVRACGRACGNQRYAHGGLAFFVIKIGAKQLGNGDSCES